MRKSLFTLAVLAILALLAVANPLKENFNRSDTASTVIVEFNPNVIKIDKQVEWEHQRKAGRTPQRILNALTNPAGNSRPLGTIVNSPSPSLANSGFVVTHDLIGNEIQVDLFEDGASYFTLPNAIPTGPRVVKRPSCFEGASVDTNAKTTGNAPTSVGTQTDLSNAPITGIPLIGGLIDPLLSYVYFPTGIEVDTKSGNVYVPGIITTTVVDTDASKVDGFMDIDIGLSTILSVVAPPDYVPLYSSLIQKGGWVSRIGAGHCGEHGVTDGGDVFICNLVGKPVEYAGKGFTVLALPVLLEVDPAAPGVPPSVHVTKSFATLLASMGVNSSTLQNMFNQFFGGSLGSGMSGLLALFGAGGQGSGGLQGVISGLLNQFTGSLGIGGTGGTIPFAGIQAGVCRKDPKHLHGSAVVVGAVGSPYLETNLKEKPGGPFIQNWADWYYEDYGGKVPEEDLKTWSGLGKP